jgi:hypothetical protein
VIVDKGLVRRGEEEPGAVVVIGDFFIHTLFSFTRTILSTASSEPPMVAVIERNASNRDSSGAALLGRSFRKVSMAACAVAVGVGAAGGAGAAFLPKLNINRAVCGTELRGATKPLHIANNRHPTTSISIILGMICCKIVMKYMADDVSSCQVARTTTTTTRHGGLSEPVFEPRKILNF